MPGTIVTLVLFVIALSLVVTNFYLRWQARQRKAYAFVALASLNALLRRLHSEAATAERENDVEFAALLARFECIQDQTRAALNGGSYDAVIYDNVIDVVEGVGRELAAFRQGEAARKLAAIKQLLN